MMERNGGPMAEPLTNWGGNIRYSTDRLHTPGSVEELAEIVRRADHVKALGTRHTFNTLADTTGELVSLRKLNGVLSFDPDGRTVTVEPGITYGQLGQYLHERGFAVTNLPSLPHVCVGGAVQTATHGSGTQNLSADVVAMEIVLADGSRRWFDSPEAVIVSLGVLGIVSQLTLRLRPTFMVQQDVYEHVPLSDLTANFDMVTRSAYSVSFFTDWQTDRVNQVWMKRYVTAPPPAFEFLGRPLTRKLHPIASVDPVNCTEQGSPGPAHLRLPHFRPDRKPSSAGQELQAEYFVKHSDAPAALHALAQVGRRLRNVLMISEVRTILADDLWLSPAYRQHIVGLHFTMQPNLPAVIEALADVIEPTLAPFHPKPHWGKLFTLDPAVVQSAYSMFGRFADLARELDPAGKFRNDFADRYVFGKAS
jgi:alditol oxidase